MQVIIKKEMLLEFKLEEILDFMPQEPFERIIFSNEATAEGLFEGVSYTDTDIAFYHILVPVNNLNSEEVNVR